MSTTVAQEAAARAAYWAAAGTAVRAAARAAAGQDSARVQPQPEGLVDRLGQDRAVPAVLEGAHEPGRGEDDLEDAVGDAARLRVRAHERPGRPARALGGPFPLAKRLRPLTGFSGWL